MIRREHTARKTEENLWAVQIIVITYYVFEYGSGQT